MSWFVTFWWELKIWSAEGLGNENKCDIFYENRFWIWKRFETKEKTIKLFVHMEFFCY